MLNIECKFNVGEIVGYMSPCGKQLTNRVESISITVGRSSYRTSAWVETAKTNVEINIIYKLENVPAGYLLSESSLFTIEQ